jgi:hypothetical protein
MILPRPSVSPLWSFPSTPTVRRAPKFSEVAGAVMSWLTGSRRQSLKHRFREAREIERLAEQLDSPDAVDSDSALPGFDRIRNPESNLPPRTRRMT